MDYLDEKNIITTKPIKLGRLTHADVRNAVLCLMLNPNDIWSRYILIIYTDLEFTKASDSRSFAIQSRFASKIARNIHIYDRYRQPLLKLLLHLATLAELDVAYYIEKIVGKVPDEVIKKHKQKKEVEDYEFDGFSSHYEIEMRGDDYYNKVLIDAKPDGETIRYPFFTKDKAHHNLPIEAPVLKMSEEELTSTLAVLTQDERRLEALIALYHPQPPTLNPDVLVPRFREYYEEHYKTPAGKRQQRIYEIVFRKMIIGKGSLEDVEAEYLNYCEEGDKMPITAKQARYGKRSKRIIDGFWEWNEKYGNNG